MKSLFYIIIFITAMFSVVSCEQKVEEFNPFRHFKDFMEEKMSDPRATHIDTLEWMAAEWQYLFHDFHQSRSRRLVDKNGYEVTNIDYRQFDSDTAFRKYLEDNDYRFVESEPKEEMITVPGPYLMENLKLAFDSWQQPWAFRLSLFNFCQYVLPYRNADEPISDWRREFKEKYEHTIIDSVPDFMDIDSVACYLMRCLRRELAYGTQMGRFYKNFMTPADMRQMHWLECRALAHYGTLVLRACGVPCAMMETHWRFTEVPHTSILLPSVEGHPKATRLSVYDDLQPMGGEKDTMASWRTWIYTYEPNFDLCELRNDVDKGAKAEAEPVTRKDVTDLFSKTYTIHLPVPKKYRKKKHLFLCRFHKYEWYPIREGRVEGDEVTFEKATIRQLYRIGAFSGNTLKTFGQVFTLLGNGRIQPYDSSGDTVLFKIAYECKATEKQLEKTITTFRWNTAGELQPVRQKAQLWGYNEKTDEYRKYEKDMPYGFKPVFHLFETRQPAWSVFTADDLPRPLGFICKDPETGEGYMMNF